MIVKEFEAVESGAEAMGVNDITVVQKQER